MTSQSPDVSGDVAKEKIPALPARWPQCAEEFITRDRKWPLPWLLEKVVEAGCHVIGALGGNQVGKYLLECVLKSKYFIFLGFKKLN